MKIELKKLQIARRLVQIFVIGLLLFIPSVSRYANYVAAREIDQNLDKWDGTLQGEALAGIDWAFRAMPGGEKERVGTIVRDRDGVMELSQNFRGGSWSAQLGPLSLSDPLGAMESILARKKVAAVLAISLIIPVLMTLLFGRVFCSWICPVGLMLEMSDKLRGWLRFLEIRPHDVHFDRRTKYALLFVGAITAFVTAAPILGYIYPPAIFNREAHDLVFGIFDRAEAGHFGFWAGGLTWASFILLGILLFEVFVSRRWWCRYVCPGGALYSLIGIVRPVRMKLIESNCTHCADCIRACPMGLNPMLNKMGAECDSCGECLSHCNDDALKYGIGLNETSVIPVITSPSNSEEKKEPANVA